MRTSSSDEFTIISTDADQVNTVQSTGVESSTDGDQVNTVQSTGVESSTDADQVNTVQSTGVESSTEETSTQWTSQTVYDETQTSFFPDSTSYLATASGDDETTTDNYTASSVQVSSEVGLSTADTEQPQYNSSVTWTADTGGATDDLQSTYTRTY